MRTDKQTTNRPKRRKKLAVLILILVVLILTSVACSYQVMTGALDRSAKKFISVDIPTGSTTKNIGAILKKNKIIASETVFTIYSKANNYSEKYLAGSYNLSPSMDMKTISEIIVSGKTNDIHFTVPEGYNEYKTARKLSNEGIVDEEKFVKLIESGRYKKDYAFLEGAQSGNHQLEGYLYPDTYKIPKNVTDDKIVRMMLDRFKEVFSDKYKARAKELGYTENEIITVASIIENEAGVPKDRKKIASVIYNRLKKNMPLQMDSTVQYLLELDGSHKENISYADTKKSSPYNTYTNNGLPPGPICSPGKDSIKAALYPSETTYLYFVASDKLDGSSTFSNSHEQFLKDKEAYAKALAKQSEK